MLVSLKNDVKLVFKPFLAEKKKSSVKYFKYRLV